MDRAAILAVVEEYERAVNEGDTEALMDLFTDDATFYDPIGWLEEFQEHCDPQPEETGLPPAFEAPEGLLGFFETCAEYFPNWEYEVEWVYVNEDLPGAAFEWTGHAHEGDDHLYARAVDVFEMDDGKVTEVRGYTSNPDTFVWD